MKMGEERWGKTRMANSMNRDGREYANKIDGETEVGKRGVE
jgi:hypothetical protein